MDVRPSPPKASAPGGFDPASLDGVIHAPTRLGIVALLAASSWAEFSFVRDSMGLSDSALSKQITILEQAGYVQVRKQGAGRRRRTLVQLSDAGRRAFEAHAAKLQALLAAAGRALPGDGGGEPAGDGPGDGGPATSPQVTPPA